MSTLTPPTLPTNDSGHLYVGDAPVRYRFTFRADLPYPGAGSPAETAVLEMLDRHGIGKYAFAEGATFTVFDHGGALWALAWRAEGNDGWEASLCPHCPFCLRMEQILVPAVGPFPLVVGAEAYGPNGRVGDNPTAGDLPDGVVLVDG